MLMIIREYKRFYISKVIFVTKVKNSFAVDVYTFKTKKEE